MDDGLLPIAREKFQTVCGVKGANSAASRMTLHFPASDCGVLPARASDSKT